MNYWYLRRNPSMTENQFTGSQLLAYMTHNLINRRLVVPIPDLWLVVISLLIAKSIKLSLERKNFSSKLLFLVVPSITIIYGWVGLQIYIFSQAILLPWLLPSLALWIYLLPALNKSHE